MDYCAFISSTSRDLKEYRQAAINVCNSLKIHPIAMEFFGAMDSGAVDGSLKELKTAQLYIGIFAHRYGYIVEGSDKSVTELEYDAAKELNIPRLCFLIDPNYHGLDDWTDHENYECLTALKARVEKEVIRQYFTSIDNFEKELTFALMKWLKEHPQSIPSQRTKVIAEGDEVTEGSILVSEVECERNWQRPFDPGSNRWEKAIGRRKELEELYCLLPPTQRSQTCAIVGMAGAGKSTLASLFHHQHAENYPGGVLWAELGETVRANDQRLQDYLNRWAVWEYGGGIEAERALKAKRYYFTPAAVKSLLSGHGLMLVVLDDIWGDIGTVSVLREAIPDEAHVLLTTRDRRIAESFSLIPLHVLSPEDAYELAHSRLPEVSDPAIQRLTHGLGYHAQALDIATADIRKRGSIERQEKAIDQLLERVEGGIGLDITQPDQLDHENYVRAALQFSYEDIGLASNGAEFQRRFRYLGSFAPPEADFDAAAAARLWEDDPLAAADFLDVLCDRSLLTQSSETRWAQHAILRSYALFLLTQSEETSDAQNRHLIHYLKQAEEGQVLEQDLSQFQHAFAQTDIETKIRIFERLIPNIQSIPAIWDTSRYFLVELLKEKRYELLDKLVLTTNSIYQEILLSVIFEFYPKADYQPIIREKLFQWLERGDDEQAHPIYVVANVAIRFEIKELLQLFLAHPQKASRDFVIQDIYRLWSKNSDLTLDLLNNLADRVNLITVRNNLETLDTLFRCSLLIILQDYYHNGSKTESVPQIRSLWQPLVRRLFLVSRFAPTEFAMKRFRRWLVQLAIIYVARMIKETEGKGQLVFKYEDLESFFPADEKRKKIFARLLPHIDAVVGAAPESLDDLTRYIEELILHDEDLLTAGVIGVALVSHLQYSPQATAEALRALAKRISEQVPETSNPAQPTASVSITMLVEVFATVNFTKLDAAVARQVLDAFVDISYTYEEHFWNTWRFKSGATIRLPGMDDALFYYALGLPQDGHQALERFLTLLVKRNDFDQIKRSIVAIADSMSFFGFPDAGMNALYDTIKLLRDYISTLDSQKREEFWDEFTDKLLLYGGKYKQQLETFVERFKGDELSIQVKRRIAEAAAQQDVGYAQVVAFAQFVSKAFSDANPFARNLIRWGVQQALEAKNLQNWFVRCVVHLTNLLYGSELIKENMAEME